MAPGAGWSFNLKIPFIPERFSGILWVQYGRPNEVL